jgi:hypothetical protein
LDKPGVISPATTATPDDIVYGMSRLDPSGRITDYALTATLGWQPGDRLMVAAHTHLAELHRDEAGLMAVNAVRIGGESARSTARQPAPPTSTRHDSCSPGWAYPRSPRPSPATPTPPTAGSPRSTSEPDYPRSPLHWQPSPANPIPWPCPPSEPPRLWWQRLVWTVATTAEAIGDTSPLSTTTDQTGKTFTDERGRSVGDFEFVTTAH